MSRIGKQPVAVPAGVKVTISGGKVTIGGPQGTLHFTPHPQVKVAWNESGNEVRLALTISPRSHPAR